MAPIFQPPGFRRLSVAPMMDWTDRHCRYLHRLFSKHTLIYTEMVTAQAVLFGDTERLLHLHPKEHPVALQLGGSDPQALAEAVKLGCEFGYDEINLNVGCPSDRVQSGRFGACLMAEPELVGDCVEAMITASSGAEITVKCRIGIDDQQPEETLPEFVSQVAQRGVRSFTIHARKAWLQGLSPKQNRDIPPLDYALVHTIAADFPDFEIIVNGGITSLATAKSFLDAGFAGVMIGRAAYHDPANMLGNADQVVFGETKGVSAYDVVKMMLPYIADELAAGQKLNQITRHMMGLFIGRPGARNWRRVLSEKAHLPGAGCDVVLAALDQVHPQENLIAQ